MQLIKTNVPTLDKKFIDCSIHGLGEALLNGSCRSCKNDKYAKDQQAQRLWDTAQKKRDSNVPERFLDVNVGNYQVSNESQAMLIKTILAYDYKRNFVLQGKVGTGKTRSACALIDIAISKNLTAYYSKYYQLTSLAIEDKAAFKKAAKVDFLVIDEFGVINTKYNTPLLFELIDRRYDARKSTMLIANLSTGTLQKEMGDALYSRIKESCISFTCDWEDYRLKDLKNA